MSIIGWLVLEAVVWTVMLFGVGAGVYSVVHDVKSGIIKKLLNEEEELNDGPTD